MEHRFKSSIYGFLFFLAIVLSCLIENYILLEEFVFILSLCVFYLTSRYIRLFIINKS